MSECFIKARELGGLILDSKQAGRYITALDKNRGDAASAEALEAERALRAFTEQILDITRATVFGAEDMGANCGSCRKRSE